MGQGSGFVGRERGKDQYLLVEWCRDQALLLESGVGLRPLGRVG